MKQWGFIINKKQKINKIIFYNFPHFDLFSSFFPIAKSISSFLENLFFPDKIKG